MRTLTQVLRRRSRYVVLRVRGDLDLDTQEALGATITRHLGSASVVVDLSRVGFVSVSSLKVLVACHRQAAGSGRRMVLVGASAQARRLFALAELDRVLELRGTVGEATGAAPAVDALDFRAS
jgi:anti-anti-sigma factor